MATPKRKRHTRRSKAQKRPKYADTSSDRELSASEQLWEAEDILDERRVGRKLQYLVQWKGTDPATKEAYTPTWEPEDNPTPALLASWHEKKAARNPASATRPCTPTRESAPPQPPASGLTSPSCAAATPAHRPSPKIHIGHRGGSFDPDHYERFSQLSALQQASSLQSESQRTDLDSSQLFAARPEYRAGIVPGSQRSSGERSFVPATQQTTGTTQPSSTASDLQEDVTEDSGLVDIVQQATSRAPSPARSIPETVYDASAESQSQQRQVEAQTQGDIAPTNTVEFQAVEVDTSQPTAATSPSTLQEGLLETYSQPPVGPSNPALTEDLTQDASFVSAVPAVVQVEVGDSPDIEQPQHEQHESNNKPLEPGPFPGQKGQSVQDGGAASPAKQSLPGVVVVEPSTVQQVASQDNTEASPPEHSVSSDAVQSSSHDQHALPNPSTPAPHPENQSRELSLADTATADFPAVEAPARSHTERPDTVPFETSATAPIQASSYNAPQDSHDSLVTSTQAEDQTRLDEFLQLKYTRSSTSPTAVLRRDFAFDFDSQTLRSTDHSTSSREQNAQITHSPNELSTQEDTSEGIRPTVEHLDAAEHSSPDSRHDSSQDSPKRRLSSLYSSSPIAQPPDFSLNTLGSQAPPRPETPIPTSSLSIMATPDVGKELGRSIKEAIAKQQAENPFKPTRRVRQSNFTLSSATPSLAGPSNAAASNTNLLQTSVLPSVTAADGTRSPSTVPDRSPAPPMPTSLRTIALTHASKAAVDLHDGQDDTPTVPSIMTTQPTVPEAEVEVVSLDNEELNDATDDDDASLINDDLQLALEEHVVPLFIEGRQCQEYSSTIMGKADVLQAFLKDPDNFDRIDKIKKLLSDLRCLETHLDLVFSEAGQPLRNDDEQDNATQTQFALVFGVDNSIKFKFLHNLFHTLREQQKHILLVTQEDSDTLYHIIETFCKGNYLQYNMPTKGRQADPVQVEGNLSITIFPSASSPIVRPADVIICLDGFQTAADIRQKNWSANPDMEVVPVLHLVISRTVGHVERYLSSSLGDRERMHTILACLAHMKNELGKPIDEDMIRAPNAANRVAEWLENIGQDRGLWPLGSIGSVKDVIEFQTQATQTSPPSPAHERPKRPHDDDEDLDPAKRMRLTPQPQDAPSSSSIGNEIEITRISDSMPGTATDDVSSLKAQILRLEQDLQDKCAAMEALQARFSEKEAMWNKQQTVHEDLAKDYRLLQYKVQQLEEKDKERTTIYETLRTRLETRTTEQRALEDQLQKQREIGSLSDDKKIAEITKLRTDVARITTEKERSDRNVTTAEKTIDYMKEQYRLAQAAAESATAKVKEFEGQIAKLTHQASGEATKLKAMHFDIVTKTQQTQLKSQAAEMAIVKKTLQLTQEEMARLRVSSGRMGVGTRATSERQSPQPNKVKSRAGSPNTRVSNLRNQ